MFPVTQQNWGELGARGNGDIDIYGFREPGGERHIGVGFVGYASKESLILEVEVERQYLQIRQMCC